MKGSMDEQIAGAGSPRVKFTNLRKVLYGRLGITKHLVIEYYMKIAPMILVFLADRAITMQRFPDGINKEGFYEKNAPKGKPFWVRTFKRFSEAADREIEYVVCNDAETLAWLANLAALEISIPLSRVDSFEKPDLVFFDIDPEPPAGFREAIDVALILREKLELLGLNSYVKTSGKKGLHVVLPVVQKYTFRETRAFVHQMGKILAKESSLIVSEFRQSKVPGTVFVDFMQNIRLKTMICPYSLRATEHATVSTPLEWREVRRGLNPNNFTILSVPERGADPWKGIFRNEQTLDFQDILMGKKANIDEPSLGDARELEARANEPQALEEYVEKRDFTKTGEPRGGSIEEEASVFVVQKHHARRLHYDFRLAREGVLKSWAVPKGVPERLGTKRLAIQTEDHPLEYSSFEGTIPEGQYGAGTVEIWDSGSYELKIWTEDKIEFYLKGSRLMGKYVLIRLKKSDAKPRGQSEWLLMKMKS